VLVDPEKLNSYGMPLTKVVDAIRNSNIIQAAGMVQENYHLYLTTVTGMMREKDQIENVVVDVVKGTPVTVKDLARVEPGEQPMYNIITADGKSAVLVNVLQQPDGNAVEIADKVNEELRSMKTTLPPDIQLAVFYDQSILVRDSIRGVTESIVIGLLLSVGVLLLFLKSWRTTLVAAVVIPIAVLIAIVFMRLFNMSLNLMTLGGLAACIGVVIDGPGTEGRSTQRHRRTDAGAGRFDADADHGVRPLGVPGRHHGSVFPRAGNDHGDRTVGVVVPRRISHASARRLLAAAAKWRCRDGYPESRAGR
jgi:multidrug efflux pump subunit AcrB